MTPLPVLVHVGEGAAAVAAEIETALPGVFDQRIEVEQPEILLALRERGVPHAVFLHDFTAFCPTRHLWHRRQEPCAGPGRTGWKCAWCVAGTQRRWPQLPWRMFAFRHRPQRWHLALQRADLVLVPSSFARDWWIEHNLAPERVVVIEPRLGPLPSHSATAAVPLAPPPLSSPRTEQAYALELIPDPLRGRAAAELVMVTPGAAPAYSRDVAEAQAAGRRVVASALGSLAAQVIHGVNGYLAAPGDFEALSESMVEALAPPGPAWGGACLATAAATQADRSRRRLERVAGVLCGAESEPPVSIHYHRQLALNHGVAFLRACGCRRVVHLPENKPPSSDAVDHFASWGLAHVAATGLPDGLWFETDAESQPADPALLRLRFPQAKALVEAADDGVETTDWLDED